jgi:hypothetical protein
MTHLLPSDPAANLPRDPPQRLRQLHSRQTTENSFFELHHRVLQRVQEEVKFP